MKSSVESSRPSKKAYAISFLALLFAFAIFNVVTVTANQDIGKGLLAAFLGTPLGPMTGAFARGFQKCCLNFSLQLLPWSAPFLVLAAVSCLPLRQRLSLWPGAFDPGVRLAIWVVGWLGWFLSGIVSFLHALS